MEIKFIVEEKFNFQIRIVEIIVQYVVGNKILRGRKIIMEEKFNFQIKIVEIIFQYVVGNKILYGNKIYDGRKI